MYLSSHSLEFGLDIAVAGKRGSVGAGVPLRHVSVVHFLTVISEPKPWCRRSIVGRIHSGFRISMLSLIGIFIWRSIKGVVWSTPPSLCSILLGELWFLRSAIHRDKDKDTVFVSVTLLFFLCLYTVRAVTLFRWLSTTVLLRQIFIGKK